MKITKIQKGLVLLSITAGAFAVGCELIVDFDRTKIPPEISEASIPDAFAADGNVQADTGTGDTGAPDADAGGTQDAGGDAETDADAG